MGIFKLISVLYKMRLLSPSSLYRLFAAIHSCGINVMTLMCFAERSYGDKTALVDEQGALTYRELLEQSQRLAVILRKNYGLASGRKAGFLCKNHASMVKAIFAVSLLGTDIYLLNAEMSGGQFKEILKRHDFDLLIYDFELNPLIEQSGYNKHGILSYHDSLSAVNNISKTYDNVKPKLQRASMGKLVLLTGGTTGSFKEAAHKPSLFNYLNPFSAVLTKLKLLKYNTAYIATPIYHGYGMAVLFLFLVLGKKVVICRGFNAEKACTLIHEHKVEVMTVVPLMVHKMLRCSPKDLKSLRCIASGGSELSQRLVSETLEKLGDVLYNLYGTSEAGLNIIAAPEDLRYSPNTLGRKIEGVNLKVLDCSGKEAENGSIGRFCIKNSWSMGSRNNSWIETGDLGYKDEKGYYFLCGRTDDMIVSAGENVYPIEVEQTLLSHPQIEDAAVIGISDEKFGKRLKAFVLPAKDGKITREELLEWLRSRLARFQMPRDVEFVDELPYTALGKVDRKRLK